MYSYIIAHQQSNRNAVIPLTKCEIINRSILSLLLFGHHDAPNPGLYAIYSPGF